MTSTRRGRLGQAAWGLWVVSLLLAPGCRNDKPSFEVLALEGKIETLDIRSDGTGEISVLYYSEKQKEEIIGTGLVTSETEILINGAVAKLADLREGDRVRGQVRVEKKGEQRKQIAWKIDVDSAIPTGGG